MRKNGWLVLVSFLGGIFLANISGQELLETYGIMNSYFLTQYSYRAIDCERLFGHVLLERLHNGGFLFLMGRVLPSKLFCDLTQCVVAIILGFLMAVSASKLGIGGIALILCVAFPHWIFYGLAFYIFAYYKKEESYQLNDRMIPKQTISFGKKSLIGNLNQIKIFSLVLALIFIGIITESYLNPLLMDKILKIF